MSSFHLYRLNQLKVIPWHVHSALEIYLKVFCVERDITACYNVISYDVGLSGRGLITSLGEGSSSGYCADRSTVGHLYINNAAMTLVTVSATLFLRAGSSLLWTHALRPFINRPIALAQKGEEF